MCGIAGFFDPTSFHSAETARASIAAMTARITHRGPDDHGIWIDETGGIALGHRRLAIIDLSPSGAQPMRSASGRWVIVYNGEIYNFERLRAELDREHPGHEWRGHSDTEVLLAAIETWGVERAVQRAIGMFAFAVWDRHTRRLYLGRDRAGEKPLYFGWQNGVLLFGSELKSLKSYPKFAASLDRTAVSAFLRFGYVPAPLSIYAGVSKVAPGTILCFEGNRSEPSAHQYWTAPVLKPDPSVGTAADASAALEALLGDAVKLQMQADVPMGAFLSGGVDSSLIVSLMQRQSGRSIKTFSIGFCEAGYNEAQHAAAVAKHLGTDHHELYITPEDALGVVPMLSEIYDEPFADSSQIPTYLLAKMTREHVTVSLSGDAGDELFGGYARYFQTQQFGELLGRTPKVARRAMAQMLDAMPRSAWQTISRIAPARYASLFSPGRLAKIVNVLGEVDAHAIYRRLVSQWPVPAHLVRGAAEPSGWFDDAVLRSSAGGIVPWMMAVDFRTYLPDDILVKVDRASMAVSLESRIPMLDHRVIEFASRVPLNFNIGSGIGKRLLRDILYRHVPRDLIDRPKQGFGVPIDMWLRGPLRDWAEELLRPERLSQDGLLNPVPIRDAWERHLSGVEDHHHPLWTVLMLQAWRQAEAAA